MREPKDFIFRGWDKTTKRFYYLHLEDCVGRDRVINIPKDTIIQQYTGLKDKNGKEIYEGDIVKSSRCHTKDVKTGTNSLKCELIEDGIEIGEVVWISNRWSVSFEHIRYDDFDDLHVEHRQEIIGNNCENPEFLCLGKTPKEDIKDEEEEEDINDLELASCEQCGEPAWDGSICHACGLKKI